MRVQFRPAPMAVGRTGALRCAGSVRLLRRKYNAQPRLRILLRLPFTKNQDRQCVRRIGQPARSSRKQRQHDDSQNHHGDRRVPEIPPRHASALLTVFRHELHRQPSGKSMDHHACDRDHKKCREMIAALKILIVPVTRGIRNEHIEKRPDIPAENVQSQRDQDTDGIVLITLLFYMVLYGPYCRLPLSTLLYRNCTRNRLYFQSKNRAASNRRARGVIGVQRIDERQHIADRALALGRSAPRLLLVPALCALSGRFFLLRRLLRKGGAGRLRVMHPVCVVARYVAEILRQAPEADVLVVIAANGGRCV